MTTDIRPSKDTSKIYYIASQCSYVAFYLRERRSPTLEDMLVDAEEIEKQLWFHEQLSRQIGNDGMNSEN